MQVTEKTWAWVPTRIDPTALAVAGAGPDIVKLDCAAGRRQCVSGQRLGRRRDGRGGHRGPLPTAARHAARDSAVTHHLCAGASMPAVSRVDSATNAHRKGDIACHFCMHAVPAPCKLTWAVHVQEMQTARSFKLLLSDVLLSDLQTQPQTSNILSHRCQRYRGARASRSSRSCWRRRTRTWAASRGRCATASARWRSTQRQW